MRRSVPFLLAALVLAPVARAAEAPTLRVMTYNIHSSKGTDGKIRPDRIAEVIRAFQPDVVALQEVRVGRTDPKTVDRPKKQSPGVSPPPVGEAPLPPPTVIPVRRPGTTPGPAVPFTDQPRVIAEATGMGYVFYPLSRRREEDYGIALLSPHPLRLVRAATLPTDPGRWFGEKRGAIWAEITVGSTTVQVIATHLGLNSDERQRQVTALLGTDWMRNADFRPPFVLCGDLNSTPVQGPYRRLASLFVDAAKSVMGDDVECTWPSRWPFARIDHVFLPPGARAFTAQVPKTPVSRVASDHLPLVVDVLFSTATPTAAAPHPAHAG